MDGCCMWFTMQKRRVFQLRCVNMCHYTIGWVESNNPIPKQEAYLCIVYAGCVSLENILMS